MKILSLIVYLHLHFTIYTHELNSTVRFGSSLPPTSSFGFFFSASFTGSGSPTVNCYSCLYRISSYVWTIHTVSPTRSRASMINREKFQPYHRRAIAREKHERKSLNRRSNITQKYWPTMTNQQPSKQPQKTETTQQNIHAINPEIKSTSASGTAAGLLAGLAKNMEDQLTDVEVFTFLVCLFALSAGAVLSLAVFPLKNLTDLVKLLSVFVVCWVGSWGMKSQHWKQCHLKFNQIWLSELICSFFS